VIPLPTTEPHKGISYVRTGSVEQGRAYGPSSQRRAIKAFAAREKVTIVAESHEDISGKTMRADRPGLSAALAAVYEHGAGVLIVAEHTRLARSEYAAYDAIDRFKVAGARVLYANGSNAVTDETELLDGVSHVLAAYERKKIVARMREGRAEKARQYPRSQAQGGKVAYGYRRTQTALVIDDQAAAHVRRIFDLIRKDSVRGVAAVGPRSVVRGLTHARPLAGHATGARAR
jgi:site-specific DNA recombinase